MRREPRKRVEPNLLVSYHEMRLQQPIRVAPLQRETRENLPGRIWYPAPIFAPLAYVTEWAWLGEYKLKNMLCTSFVCLHPPQPGCEETHTQCLVAGLF